MRILLTNDDGITAPGLAALYHAILDMGEIHVVAPSWMQSATGHSVTFHQPIPTRRHRVITDYGDPIDGIAVEGRPADCIKLGVNVLVKQPIDLIISGMNAGVNVGVNVLYSGTVAAAVEGAIQGVPSIAVSLHIGDRSKTRWPQAAAHARRILDRLIAGPLDPNTVLNVNLPILDDGAEPVGVRVVPICTSALIDRYNPHQDLAGDQGYSAVDSIALRHTQPDTDVDAIFQRYITITPLTLDMTHVAHLSAWSEHLANGSAT